MTVLTAQDLHKSFSLQVILDGVSMAIDTGERVGLVGINGSGKSTLSRILAGVETADSGVVSRRRGAEIVYLAQEPAFEPDAIARDVVLAGLAAWSEAKARHDAASAALSRGEGDQSALLDAQATASADVERHGGWEWMHKAESIMGHVGVSQPDSPMAALSGGDRRRVALARTLLAQPDLAILDEPSNHLDAETVEWLESYLIDEHKGAILMITHDRYLLDRVAERTLELDRGKIFSYDGGYEDYLEAKAERLAVVARTESNRQNFLRRELEWLRRQPQGRSTKQKARIHRAEAARDTVAVKGDRTAVLQFDASRGGKTLLELKGLELAMGGRTLIRPLDYVLTQGERVGIVGRNGTGKTTLLRAILGEVTPVRGEITLGKNTSIAYFDQQRGGLDDATSIYENVAGSGTRIEIGGQSLDVRTYLERFLFDPHKQRQPVGSLSGGERARVALAKMLLKSASLVMLDEPTNDLDVATLGALEQLMVELGATAVVVTHDRYFLDRVATSILAFEGDGRVVRYAGNYASYREQRARAVADDATAARADASAKTRPTGSRPAPGPASGSAARPRPRSLTYGERIELEGILDRVDGAEREVAAVEARLADPTLYAARGDEVPGLVSDLERSRAEVARLTARWEELEARRGEEKS